jgi:hypothetical protein
MIRSERPRLQQAPPVRVHPCLPLRIGLGTPRETEAGDPEQSLGCGGVTLGVPRTTFVRPSGTHPDPSGGGANAGSRTRINGFGGHYTIHCATFARSDAHEAPARGERQARLRPPPRLRHVIRDKSAGRGPRRGGAMLTQQKGPGMAPALCSGRPAAPTRCWILIRSAGPSGPSSGSGRPRGTDRRRSSDDGPRGSPCSRCSRSCAARGSKRRGRRHRS